jgi:hypothetical protein
VPKTLPKGHDMTKPSDQYTDPVAIALDKMTKAMIDNTDPVAAVLSASKSLPAAQRHALGVAIIGILTATTTGKGPLDGQVRKRLAEVAAGL